MLPGRVDVEEGLGDVDILLDIVEREGQLGPARLDQRPLLEILGFDLEDQRHLDTANRCLIADGDRHIGIGGHDIDNVCVEQVDLVGQELAQRHLFLRVGILGLVAPVDDIEPASDRNDLVARGGRVAETDLVRAIEK